MAASSSIVIKGWKIKTKSITSYILKDIESSVKKGYLYKKILRILRKIDIEKLDMNAYESYSFSSSYSCLMEDSSELIVNTLLCINNSSLALANYQSLYKNNNECKIIIQTVKSDTWFSRYNIDSTPTLIMDITLIPKVYPRMKIGQLYFNFGKGGTEKFILKNFAINIFRCKGLVGPLSLEGRVANYSLFTTNNYIHNMFLNLNSTMWDSKEKNLTEWKVLAKSENENTHISIKYNEDVAIIEKLLENIGEEITPNIAYFFKSYATKKPTYSLDKLYSNSFYKNYDFMLLKYFDYTLYKETVIRLITNININIGNSGFIETSLYLLNYDIINDPSVAKCIVEHYRCHTSSSVFTFFNKETLIKYITENNIGDFYNMKYKEIMDIQTIRDIYKKSDEKFIGATRIFKFFHRTGDLEYKELKDAFKSAAESWIYKRTNKKFIFSFSSTRVIKNLKFNINILIMINDKKIFSELNNDNINKINIKEKYSNRLLGPTLSHRFIFSNNSYLGKILKLEGFGKEIISVHVVFSQDSINSIELFNITSAMLADIDTLIDDNDNNPICVYSSNNIDLKKAINISKDMSKLEEVPNRFGGFTLPKFGNLKITGLNEITKPFEKIAKIIDEEINLEDAINSYDKAKVEELFCNSENYLPADYSYDEESSFNKWYTNFETTILLTRELNYTFYIKNLIPMIVSKFDLNTINRLPDIYPLLSVDFVKILLEKKYFSERLVCCLKLICKDDLIKYYAFLKNYINIQDILEVYNKVDDIVSLTYSL